MESEAKDPLDRPEVDNLVDVRGWALATLLQIARVRQAWAAIYANRDARARAATEDSDEIRFAHPDFSASERLDFDVHFLVIAANQLVDARRRKLDVPLPRLSKALERAIENLRDVREHYEHHRDGFYGDAPLTPKGAALRAAADFAHPWTVRGSITPPDGHEIVIAEVLDLDDFAPQVQDIYDAAHAAAEALIAPYRATEG